MNVRRWSSLIVFSFVVCAVASGCGVKKQVRYTSGPPNVAVSAQGLSDQSDSRPTEYTFNGTRYVHINNGAE